jgi:hypothetical protein
MSINIFNPVYQQSKKQIKFEEKIKYICNNINIFYDLSKTTIDKIINLLLIKNLNYVVGYDKYEDKYWFKKYCKKNCVLHVEIKLFDKGYDLTQIKLSPQLFTDKTIETFKINLNETIQLYKTTTIIKDVIDGKLEL